ncbi:histidine phosphatase family protein [Klebsiella oxytoca]|uniref:histidine phosphatase family protein n=1 Tax=Klebsiella oxytoca TaxID=571 RepID=UPI0039C98644
MEIILMRHGPPSQTGYLKVASHEMADWITKYDLSDTGSDIPPESSKLIASRASRFLSSPMPRAVSSLRTLGLEPQFIDGIFSEAELPLFRIPVFRLPPLYWTVFFRIMWIVGISRKTECLRDAKQRAAQATNILVHFAKESDGPVLLMGHGIMNRLIARELKSLGWTEHSPPGKGYWSAGVYRNPK